MSRRLAIPALLAVLLGLLLSGCGGGGDDGPEPVERPVEKADPPAKLPPGWRTLTNTAGGFTIGVPPGWTTKLRGTTTVLGSPDKLVAISATADRTDEALRAPLERFALGAAEALSGFENLKVEDSAQFKHRYQAVAVGATGTLAESGVKQKLLLVILRRDNLATYPVLAATNVGRRSPFASQIPGIVRSLRGRPVEVPG